MGKGNLSKFPKKIKIVYHIPSFIQKILYLSIVDVKNKPDEFQKTYFVTPNYVGFHLTGVKYRF